MLRLTTCCRIDNMLSSLRLSEHFRQSSAFHTEKQECFHLFHVEQMSFPENVFHRFKISRTEIQMPAPYS
jgi:hypothetical protein